MKKLNRALNLILPFLPVTAIIVLWVISARSVNNDILLPTVKQTLIALVDLFKDKQFYISLLGTVLRSFIAFVLSFIIAFILAVVTVKNSTAQKIISPIIKIMRALPTIAVILLLLLWTNSFIAPIVVTTLVVLPTSYTHLESAFSALDKTVAEAGRVDGANEFNVFTMVELPQALPSVFSSIGSGISLNFKLMVAAEVLAQTAKSIGYMLNVSKAYFETAEMVALVVIAILFGVIIESLFNFIAKKTER